MERLAFATRGFRRTLRFFERLGVLCTRWPVAAVGETARSAAEAVACVDGRASELTLEDRTATLAGPRWIGVEEVSHTGGQMHFTMVTNRKSGWVAWIGDGKGRKGFLSFLRALEPKGRWRIQGAIGDPGYPVIRATGLPHAVPVPGRSHIVQRPNEAPNQLRRTLFPGVPRDEPGRAFNVRKRRLLPARKGLEHRDPRLLTRRMEQDQLLYRPCLLLERLRAIPCHPWKHLGVMRERLQEWILGVFDIGLEALVRGAHRVANQLDAGIAGCAPAAPLNLVEITNGRTAGLRLRARGYRDQQHFKLKILPRCGLPHDPGTRIVR